MWKFTIGYYYVFVLNGGQTLIGEVKAYDGKIVQIQGWCSENDKPDPELFISINTSYLATAIPESVYKQMLENRTLKL